MTGGIHIRGVILAAGAGERARPLTADIPKALVNVAGGALLEWNLQNYCLAGVQEVTIAIGYKASMIEDYLKSRQQRIDCEQGINVVVVRDYEIGPLRTALTALETFSDEACFISPVDTIIKSETIKEMLDRYASSKGMILAVDYNADTGTPVYVDQSGLIVGLGDPKPEGEFSAGRSVMLLIANRVIVDYCRSALLRNENRLVQALNRMIKDGIPLYSHEIHTEWFDIDTLSDVLSLNRHLLESVAVDGFKRGVFIPNGDLMQIGDRLELGDSDIVLNTNVHLQGPVLISPGCRIAHGCRIGPNVTIGSATSISDNCELINTIVHSKSIIDAHSHIENAIVYGSQIYHVEL